MTTIFAHFDGKAFVPTQPVDLPIGAQVFISIPDGETPPRSHQTFTSDEDLDWQSILAQIRTGEPAPATVEGAMDQIRMRAMILLDTDVLIIDLRYTRDARFAANRQFLDHSQARQFLGITCQTLLEVVGKFSFNVATIDIPKLVAQIPRRYATVVLPDPAQTTDYAGCTIVEVLQAIETKMALGDAVNAVQIARYASSASCLLSWNARHYHGKLVVPVLTPQEWLQRIS